MVDPISTAIASGAAGAISERVIQQFVSEESEDLEQWKISAINLAADVQAKYDYQMDSARVPDRDELKRSLERFGTEAQKLAVVAKQRNYPDSDVAAVEGLAELCGEYAASPNVSSGEYEQELGDQIQPVVTSVFELADHE